MLDHRFLEQDLDQMMNGKVIIECGWHLSEIMEGETLPISKSGVLFFFKRIQNEHYNWTSGIAFFARFFQMEESPKKYNETI